MFKTCWLLIFTIAFGASSAQNNDHINWHFSSLKQMGSEWNLVFTATIDRGWHVYSQATGEDGPMPTAFSFKPNDDYRLTGKVTENGDLKKSYDPTFMTDVAWYNDKVIFRQVVKVKKKTKVSGEIDYQVCSEDVCIPGSAKFSIDVGN